MSALTALLKPQSVLLVLLLPPCQPSACLERAALPHPGSLGKKKTEGEEGWIQGFLFILSPAASGGATGCLCHSADK